MSNLLDVPDGKLIWNKQNIGQKQDNGLMRVQYDAIDQVLALLDGGSTYH